MHVLKPGHRYQLDGMGKEGEILVGQLVQFYDNETGEQVQGTTNEEVLEMLLDRLRYLNNKMHSPFNEGAIWHCQEALNVLNARTNDRRSRGVEGTNQN